MLAAPYIIPLTNMAMTGGSDSKILESLMDFCFLCLGSVYTVVAITIERYTTLRQLHKVGGLPGFMTHMAGFVLQCQLKGRCLIFSIIFFSVSYNFVKFFELTVDVKVE